MSTRLVGSIARSNVSFSGRHKITGTISKSGVFGAYPMTLSAMEFAYPLATGHSDIAGNFSFLGLAYIPRGYYITSHDTAPTPINGAIWDNITPVPM